MKSKNSSTYNLRIDCICCVRIRQIIKVIAVFSSRQKDELITFNRTLDIGTKVAVEITRDFLIARGIEVASTTANPWSQSPLPPIYMGELDDIELNIGREGTRILTIFLLSTTRLNLSKTVRVL